MLLGYEGDVGRARDYTGQWRPLSYSVGYRLRPPSRTLWIDPDYPSGSNPQRLALPGRLPPKKTHFSGQRIPDTVPLNCENSTHNGDCEEKEIQNPNCSPHPPYTHPTVTLGKAKEQSLILGIPLNILGLAADPLSAPSLPPAKANSDWTHLVRPILKVPPLRRNNHIY